MSEPFRIGIAGLGTVGAGVVKILQQHADSIASKAGRKIEITAVNARSKDKDRGVDLSAYNWADKPQDLSSMEIDAVIELIGGEDGDALELVEQTLQNQKHVVTANKALLAKHGLKLASIAENNGVGLAYEASVAGGIPAIKAIREGFVANEINSVYGILNGTCNYILTEMRETKRDFVDVLKEAQEKGYAEADPTFDIGGFDAGHKLSLLCALAFGVKPDFERLPIQGIEHINQTDISYADFLGYKIKLIGLASLYKGQLMQAVEPCMVHKNTTIGGVEGVFNAVRVSGDFVDRGMLIGHGAGQGPTASAVVADIIDLARGDIRPVFGVPVCELKEANWASLDDMISRFYLRLEVNDQPGVIADLSSILSEHNISIEDLIQRGAKEGQSVPIVLTTHVTTLHEMKVACAEIEKHEAVQQAPCLIRIEEF